MKIPIIDTTNGKFRYMIVASPEKDWIIAVAFLQNMEVNAVAFTSPPFEVACRVLPGALASAAEPLGDASA